ncbi:MAG TPA: phosphoglyceromutase [Acidimicrobiales bacterium]|nr:phosphoglyceromutase [Acidimicrobiales bacterium]
MPTLVLLRHGQSEWNRLNLFTGWHDVDLTEQGEAEARSAGQLLLDEQLEVDIAHTSLQKRAIRTANLALEVADRLWIPTHRHWRLNERHYGALQGLDKAETLRKYGEEQLNAWRRGYATPPPPLERDDERHPRHDARYATLPPDLLPASECLADVIARMLPYWYDHVCPDLLEGRTVLVAAHGNSLRGLIKHLDDMSEDEIVELNVPTGIPLVYELDEHLVKVSARYLGDPEAARRAADAVAAQASAPAPAEAEPDDPGDDPAS